MTFLLPQDSQDSAMDTYIAATVDCRIGTSCSPATGEKSTTAEASYLAHDTRNWLTVLQMYCDLLRTPGTVASGHQNWIDELSGAVERGQGLVVSLLDSMQAANRASGLGTAAMKTAAAPAALDVAEALGRRMELLERMAGDGICVELQADLWAGKAAIDESAFERILYNLTGNAMEAMPGGGRLRLTVRSGARRKDDDASKTVLLRVFDTGEGIRRECLKKIFEAGVSGKGEEKNGGAGRGFGLAIVRELTERAGGKVRVRSHPGRGSCFELEFPAA